MDLKPITPDFTASPQLSPEEVGEAARLGFTTLINNRPDGEASDQPRSDEIEAAASAQGLDYHYIPVAGAMITEDGVDAFTKALEDAQGPVLAFCRSGTRSTMLWAVSQARRTPGDDLIKTAGEAGYDISGLRAVFDARFAAGEGSDAG